MAILVECMRCRSGQVAILADSMLASDLGYNAGAAVSHMGADLSQPMAAEVEIADANDAAAARKRGLIKPTPNNFDLIRLFAASQVALVHTAIHTGIGGAAAIQILRFFPGVPAFFLISGFLISASWEKTPDLGVYTTNRVLRIFPGLILAVSLTAAMILVTSGLGVLSLRFVAWYLAQITLFQDWHPAFTQHFSATALWTISIELCFYAAVPMIYWLFRKTGRPTLVLCAIVVLSFATLYAMGGSGFEGGAHGTITTAKILSATPIPWIGMFCCGVLAQRHLGKVLQLVAGRLPLFLVIYIAISAATYVHPLGPVLMLSEDANTMGILNYTAYALLVLSAAFSWRSTAEKLLRRNDISYGVYIFHMPVVNTFVFFQITTPMTMLYVALIVPVLATLSWRFVESPALGLKRKTIYNHPSASQEFQPANS